MIKIVPAIDIIDAHCVRLSKGDYNSKKEYGASPVDMALRFQDCGVERIHLVDLDGAKASSPRNLKTLEAIAGKVSIELEWGGGIADPAAIRDVFNAGATHAIVGSVAALKPELFQSWLLAYGSRMTLGADVKEGKVAVKGWLESTDLGIDELVEKFRPQGLSECICTEISRDGMLQGPAKELYTALQDKFSDVSFTVSGGISCMDDIRQLNDLNLRKVIVGKAIYENRISLKEIEQWSQNA